MRLILAIPTGLVFAWLFVATWGSSQFWEVLFHWLAFGLVWFGWDRGKELLLLMWMNRRSAHSFAEEIVTAISTMLLIAVMVIMWLPFFAFDAKGAFWATLPRPAN
jgi:hypothetical protein